MIAYIKGMKRVLLPLSVAVCVLAAPVWAQDDTEEDGFSLMERGAELLLEGIVREMDPALDDLRGMFEEIEPGLRTFLDEMGPALAELMGKIDDISAYHPPEMLPNGDIIIRRKSPLEETDEGGEIEI